MKNILIAALLLTASLSVQAHDSGLGIIAKAGTTLSEDDGNTSSIMLTVQVDDCQHCITGSIIHLDNAGLEGENKKFGLGVDYLYKFPNPGDRWYYLTGGAYMFGGRINDEALDNLSYHAGAGMDLGGFVLAVDVFGQPFGSDVKWSPITLFSAGWHF